MVRRNKNFFGKASVLTVDYNTADKEEKSGNGDENSLEKGRYPSPFLFLWVCGMLKQKTVKIFLIQEGL